MNVLKTAGAIVMALSLAAIAASDEPPTPQVTPEHEALGVWVGGWSGEGDMKAGLFGEGGPMTWTETCSWFEGSHFHVICRSEGTGPMGPSKGLGVIGYNPDKGVYTNYGIDSTGWSGYSEGTRDGDSWTFTSTEQMAGKTYHSRFTMVMGKDDAMSFSWEMSEDGEQWMVMMDGTSTKQ
jgi:hypothetical protein